MSAVPPKVTRVDDATFRVEHDGRVHTVYVAGPAGRRTAWFDGHLFAEPAEAAPVHRGTAGHDGPQTLYAPMPATVRAVFVAAGAKVRNGETLIVLEAMKMELALRAPIDGVVRSVACKVGDLVQPDVALLELAPE